MIIKDFLKEKGYYEFNINTWGSCQYSGALAMYNAYFEMRKTHSIENMLEYLKYEFEYEILFDSINNDAVAKEEFLYYLNKYYQFNLEDLYDFANIEKLDESGQRFIKSIWRSMSADDLFFASRQACSDLWHTAPRIAQSYFKGLKIKNVPTFDKPLGIEVGPIGNICSQSGNIETGICCALLYDYGIVKNEKSFSGFDT